MRHITVPIEQLPKMFRQYGVMMRSHTDARMMQVESRAKEIVKDQTENAPPASANGGIGAVDTRKYYRKWRVRRARLNGSRGVLITNAAHYMAVIELGRRAGSRMPPVDVIRQWAQRRLGLPYKEAKRAAWPIARAIGRRGLQARLVMTGDPAKREYFKTMQKYMGLALDEASLRVFK